MPALKFEKLLCGPAVDMFRKDFVNENIWEVEHADARKGASFTNTLTLNKDQKLVGSTSVNVDVGAANFEMKLGNKGDRYLELSSMNAHWPTMKVLSKYMFNPPNKNNACEVVAENVHPINTTQLKIIPFARDYSMFSLFNYKLNCCQLFGGMEVTGKNCTLFSNYTMALGYKRIRDEKTYQLSARVFGDKGALAKSFVGNVYVGTAHGDAQNAMAVALEHQLKDGHTKLMFSGLWHLTEPGHATPAFVKGKCDTDGQFALSYSQRFNKNIAGILTVGGNMNSTCDPATMNYGYKVTVS